MTAGLVDGIARAPAIRLDTGSRESFEDLVVAEAPVAMVYNGRSYAVMMATPADLADFGLGFALTEGVVASADEFRIVDCLRTDVGISLQASIPQQRFDALDSRTRNLAATSGCGLCGTESLQGAMRPVRQVGSADGVPASRISDGVRRLAANQRMNRSSGGVHAAGFVHANGILVREDVGRHNALDKLAGALACQAAGPGFLVMSSRASYELVHKAAAIGIAIVVAISAPTDLAISTAEEAGITLVAFARGDSMTIYSHPHRVL